MSTQHEVVVIGAGLAGLMCARTLQAQGVDVHVVEAGDAVGGRIRTDVIDGFAMDRGFQVLNPAYPAVQEHVDIAALGLQKFGSGAGVIRDDGQLVVLADPLREPQHLLDVLRSGYLDPGELVSLARWAAPSLGPPSKLKDGPDRSRGAAMASVGLSGPLSRVVDSFVAGVVLEDDGSTSNNFTRLLMRMFAFGSPGLPERGMQAFPQQLADGLLRPVQTGTAVQEVTDTDRGAQVRTTEGTLAADLVVLAAGPVASAHLLERPEPAMKGVVTDWFTMPQAPSDLPMLIVDGRQQPGGPIKNTAVVTAAAPSYAPSGRPLVQTSALMRPGEQAPSVPQILSHAAQTYGVSTDDWQLVHRHEVPHALPMQHPPLSTRRSMQVSEHVIACGDHVDTASIQGAMVSGERAAQGYLLRRSRRL
ncbi:MAG: NAD(P)/FAD-dependent oxidoreductase [Ornithinimicrobium sp.]